MTKKADVIEELEDIEETEVTDEVEDDDEETNLGTRPVDLAKELDISPKTLRAWLRRNYPRPLEDKNTSWFLTDAQVEAVYEAFLPSEDDEDEVEETEEVVEV